MSSQRMSTTTTRSSSSPLDPSPPVTNSNSPQEEQASPTSTTPTAPVVLVGTVFARQQLFATLSPQLQEDAKAFRAYVEKDKQWLFRTHHHALVKSVYCVKSKNLIDVIVHWLQTRIVPHHEATDSSSVSADQPTTTRGRAATVPASITKTHLRGSPEKIKKAKHIAEALVLLGFLTPYKDDKVYQNFLAADYYVQGSELLIPVAPNVTELKTTSVWSVVDGALYAHALKRKAGVLGSFSQGKDVYVVFNARTKKAYLFESDLAREPIAELKGATMTVEFENANFEFGVHVQYNKYFKPEVFNAETESAQLAFVFACLGIGAKYAEGNVKKLILAEKSGLIACDGVSGDQNERDVDETTEPHDVAMATAMAASISGLEPERHSGEMPPRTVTFADGAPTSAEHLDDQSVGEHLTSSADQTQHAGSSPASAVPQLEDQPIGEHEHQQDVSSEPNAVELLGRHDSWYSAYSEDLNQPEDSYRISAEHQVEEQQPVASPPASAEQQGYRLGGRSLSSEQQSYRLDRRSASMGPQNRPGDANPTSAGKQEGYNPVGLFTTSE